MTYHMFLNSTKYSAVFESINKGCDIMELGGFGLSNTGRLEGVRGWSQVSKVTPSVPRDTKTEPIFSKMEFHSHPKSKQINYMEIKTN